MIEKYTPEQAERLALIAPELLTIAHDLHALLWHYDLRRQPNGVDWAAPEVLRQEYINRLEDLFKRMEVKT
jgi:hypothetical protein